MDNSFFVLSKQKVEIFRFHICTWDIENEKSFIEIGMEFIFPNNSNEIDLKFIAPFVQKEDKIRCLLDQLKLRENSKFIFNDVILNSSPINEDDIHGTVLDFKSRDKLAILPLMDNIKIEATGIISFKIKKPIENVDNFYIRFLINTSAKTLSTQKKGIAKTTFLYDIKLNENRNLPNNVATLMSEYTLCKVNECFCFHVVPNSYNISFVDQNKLKNIRELEVSAFKKYLPKELKTMKEGKYMIIFNKEKDSDSYSFFSIFTRETIGTKQIIFAIGTNVLCSLLFGISALRNSFDNDINFWKQIPIEYWISLLILLVFLLWLFNPLKTIKAFFRGVKI